MIRKIAGTVAIQTCTLAAAAVMLIAVGEAIQWWMFARDGK